ncbi:MAG: hypothetical protein SGPRY_006612 [Prymnesium sp.]
MPTPSCGLGSEDKAVQLAMLSLSNARGADERESARGVLSSFWGHSQARACFILKIGRGTSPSSNFNVRAWLYYEAGRHADLDLTPLQASALAKGSQMWGGVLGLCGGHLKPASSNLIVISPPQPKGGEWPRAGHSAADWWARAAVHAHGDHAARFYALMSADAVSSVPKAWIHSLLQGQSSTEMNSRELTVFSAKRVSMEASLLHGKRRGSRGARRWSSSSNS